MTGLHNRESEVGFGDEDVGILPVEALGGHALGFRKKHLLRLFFSSGHYLVIYSRDSGSGSIGIGIGIGIAGLSMMSMRWWGECEILQSGMHGFNGNCVGLGLFLHLGEGSLEVIYAGDNFEDAVLD